MRSGAIVAGLLVTLAAANAQTSLINPELYDNSTANTEFAARGSLEFDPPTRSNVLVVGDGFLIAGEPTRATNPWASVLDEPQPFELNYNVDTGDITWDLLGASLTGNHLLPVGTGLAYIMPLVKVQTPTGAADNLARLSDVTVSINGAAGINHGSWEHSGNGHNSGVIYLTQYNVHTVKITGNMTFDIPETWSDEINGTYADLAFVSAQPVPEPATMAVMGIGIVAALRRRRKRS